MRPANLLRFLSSLDREVHPESPVYFGAAFGTFACDVDERDVCRAFSHNKGVPSEAQVRTWKARKWPQKMKLRETRGWMGLQSDFFPSAADDALANLTGVMYAMGGVYGFS